MAVTTIPRDRLLDPLSATRVVVMIAPGGSGKTTLAEDLVARWDLAPVRVRLRDATGPEALVEGVRRALRRAGWSDLAGAVSADDPDLALDQLLGALHADGTGIAWLVDDVQLLEPSAWELLEPWTADLPPACRAVVCGRSTPGPRRESRRTRLVTADDLRMTPDEISDLLAAGRGEPPPAHVVAEVDRATLGWTAAVAVAAARLQSDPTWTPSGRGAGRGLLAGLVAPLLGEHLATLPVLAAVPLLDDTVAELLAGPGALERLRRSGVPHRVERAEWTVIPDAVREALEAVAGDSPPELPADVVLRVARHYASRGEMSAALLLAGRHPDASVRATLLGERHWTELETVGFTLLAQLIDSLPDDVAREHPRALLTASQAAEFHRPALRGEWLDRLERLGGIADEVTRAVDAERARHLVRQVRTDDAVELARSVLARAGPDEAMTRARALLALAHASAFMAQPASYEVAARAFSDAAELFGLAGERRWQSESLARLGYNVLFHRGQVAEAAARMDDAISLLPIGDRTRAAWLASLADVQEWLGNRALADAAVSEAIEIGTRLRDADVIGLAQWTKAWLHGWRRDLAGVRAAYAEVERLQPSWLDGSQGAEFYGSLCDHFVVLGDLDSMRECEEKARQIGESLGYRQAVDFMHVRVDAVIGDPAAALTLLADIGRGRGAPINTRWVRSLEAAVASLRLGDAEQARRFVDEAIALVTEMGLPDLPRRMEGPLVDLLAPVWPHATADADDELTTVTMLGTFAVHGTGGDLTPPAGHPSTLLKLLALGGPMTSDALVDALWPDADVDTGRSRLRNTLNRLKGRTGNCVVRRGEVLSLASSVRCDLEAFEQASAEALAADEAHRVGLARQAIALYAGELLPGDVYADWAAAPRERARRRYLAQLDLVADAAEATGNFDEAARLLDLGLTADPLDEGRSERLAAVLVAQGRLGVARQVAERARDVLAELGLDVGPALRRLLA
jgi:DNA-binding SARP family transcriptional activator